MIIELLFNQKKEGEEPEAVQEKLMELLDSTTSLAEADTSTIDTGTVDVRKRCTVGGNCRGGLS